MGLANHRVRTFQNAAELQTFINTASIAATLVGGTQTFGFTFGGVGETLVVEGSSDGGATWHAFRRVFTVGAAGPHASIAALLAELNTAARWDGASLPTEFTIANTGDALTITHALNGPGYALRIGAGSSALGSVANEDLLFDEGARAVGNQGSSALLTVEQLITTGGGTFVLVYTV